MKSEANFGSRDRALSELAERLVEIEGRLPLNVRGRKVAYITPVNFVESMSTARHRWFPYKEGFSPSFVESILREYSSDPKGAVLDPFSGVGSTCLVSAVAGRDSVGIEVSPFAHFVASSKAIELSPSLIKDLSELIRQIENGIANEPDAFPNNQTVKSYYEEDVLEEMMRVKSLIRDLDGEVSDLLKLAFLSRVEVWSTHRRAGNGVKKKVPSRYRGGRENARQWIQDELAAALRVFSDDLSTMSIGIHPDFRNESCLDESAYLEIENVETAITSPPYPNCFDYSKIYLRELWLGDFFQAQEDQRKFRQGSVQSHVHSSWPDRHGALGSEIVSDLIRPLLERSQIWSERIPAMLEGYFADMGKTLQNVHRVLRKGGVFSLVVGNSHYAGVPVPVDILLAELASGLGYAVERIDVHRQIVPSAQHLLSSHNLHFARESNVILRKV